jgi:ABC-type dipeptide/oligopeptide/nickel transport system permease component
MKNPLTRAIVFIVFGIACFIVSLFPRDMIVEKLSSFLFGFSLPLFLAGIIYLIRYAKKRKQTTETDNFS